nr:MAG TPA: hypothetical protein [Caudoviricetes sp.]DAW31526.1 MAG TPA: hypothetical protein [Caudoviricetes sp.]
MVRIHARRQRRRDAWIKQHIKTPAIRRTDAALTGTG